MFWLVRTRLVWGQKPTNMWSLLTWLLLSLIYVLVVCLAFEEWGTRSPWPILNITRQCSGCFKFYRFTTECHTCHQTQLCDDCHWRCFAQLVLNIRLGDQVYLRIDGNINCLNRQCTGTIIAPDLLSARELICIGTTQRSKQSYCAA